MGMNSEIDVKMEISEASIPVYVYQCEGRTIHLEKSLVERYAKESRPVDETFIHYMIKMYSRENDDDTELSYKIALVMAGELIEEWWYTHEQIELSMKGLL